MDYLQKVRHGVTRLLLWGCSKLFGLRGFGIVRLKDYLLLPKSGLTYAQDLLYTYHNADFLKDPLFIESYDLAKETDEGHLIGDSGIHWRIHVLCWAAYHAKQLEGDFVDCGAGSGIIARAVINYVGFQGLDKRYYLLDTFSGMDERYSSEYEMQRNEILGYARRIGLYEQVKRTFSGYNNVEIIRGAVPDTLPLVKVQKVSFLSIDMNSVKPEVDALEHFWPRMVSGGMVILDDYGYPGCLDQKRAHDDFARSKGVKVLALPTCQGLIIKP